MRNFRFDHAASPSSVFLPSPLETEISQQILEFASSEISQTLRDFLEYLNRSNTFCTNLKEQIILAPRTLPRIGTGHVGHAKIEISQRIRTPNSLWLRSLLFLLRKNRILIETFLGKQKLEKGKTKISVREAMGDQVCEIEEIEEEATMATVQEHRKVNYNAPDSSDGGPHISSRDISPTPAAQNGGDKTDEEQRRHRKGKDGSGGLPLYVFLQESVASEGGKKVDPRCPNASNPYHMCTDHCLIKMSETKRDDAPKSPFSFRSRHSRSSSSVGSSREGAKVDPRCPNSANPYHECTDNCRSKVGQTDRDDGTKYPFPIIPHGSPTSSEGSSRESRKVDPRCPNSSNPYHECTDNCRSKFRQTDRKDKAKSPSHLFSRSSRSSSAANSRKLGDSGKVDPRCVNASNPYHECSDNCFKKLQEGNHTVPNTPDSSTSRKSKGNVQSVERREGVQPDCVNASNPYHKCSNHCFEKMQR